MQFIGLTQPAPSPYTLMFNPRTFPCLSCREFINESMRQCRFCGAPVDPAAAHAAVEMQERINRACNDASMIRNLAGAMWLCFLLRFVPVMGCFAGVALLGLFFFVPIRLLIWQSSYGGLNTADVDYQRAKRNALTALGLWGLMLAVPFVLIFFVVGLTALVGR